MPCGVAEQLHGNHYDCHARDESSYYPACAPKNAAKTLGCCRIACHWFPYGMPIGRFRVHPQLAEATRIECGWVEGPATGLRRLRIRDGRFWPHLAGEASARVLIQLARQA